MCAFLYVVLATVCTLQATAIQAEPVDSLHVQAEEEEKTGRISLPSTALLMSTPGTAMLADGGGSGALLRVAGTYGDRPGRQVHHRRPGWWRYPKSTTTDSTQADSGSAGAGKRFRADADDLDAAESDRSEVVLEAGQIDSREFEKRFVKKLVIGALIGAVPTFYLGNIMTSASNGSDVDGLGSWLIFEFTMMVGYPILSAIGVSLVDPHDRFSRSLAGSVAGAVINLFFMDERTRTYGVSGSRLSSNLRWFFSPVFGATIFSEASRKVPADRRVSLALSPIPQGGLSAVAKLRF